MVFANSLRAASLQLILFINYCSARGAGFLVSSSEHLLVARVFSDNCFTSPPHTEKPTRMKFVGLRL